jgi:hypothetical protein
LQQNHPGDESVEEKDRIDSEHPSLLTDHLVHEDDRSCRGVEEERESKKIKRVKRERQTSSTPNKSNCDNDSFDKELIVNVREISSRRVTCL